LRSARWPPSSSCPCWRWFAVYLVLADRVAKRPEVSGIDGLAAAMLVAAVAVTPFVWDAAPAFGDPAALLAGIGVGVCSSVIRTSPTRSRSGAQLPTGSEAAGVALVVAGVALHR
jgi:inner membrane transporter RhtA